jgi:signal transduction histidine kinase
MVVQAGGARRILPRDPARAADAAGVIAQTGREALSEMRRLLKVVAGADGAGAREPQPGLDGLDALAGRARAAGLDVEVRREGEPLRLPAGVDLAAYRVVQEALTNTLKHAGPTSARVFVRFTPGRLAVEVADDGRRNGAGPAAGAVDSGGHGLVGMRERVALYDGELEACPHDGGFLVRAELPLEDG